MLATQALVLLFPVLVASHGMIISPAPREPGPASLAACGSAVTNSIMADPQGTIEGLRTASIADEGFDPKSCSLNLCKGLKFEDNQDKLQTWSPGQVVNVKVVTRVPHMGWVSVAIVDTQTARLVGGKSLISFETTSLSGYGIDAKADMDFNITIPDIYPQCAVPQECVLQWTWFGRVVKQTFESCVDFVITKDPKLALVQTEGEQLQKYIGGRIAF